MKNDIVFERGICFRKYCKCLLGTFIIQHTELGVFLLCKITNLLIYSNYRKRSFTFVFSSDIAVEKFRKKRKIPDKNDLRYCNRYG